VEDRSPSGVVHAPVMVEEVVRILDPRDGAVLVDATVGLGGHARALLERSPGIRVIGFDLDPDALALAHERLAPWAARVTLVAASYGELSERLADLGVPAIDGVVFDLGVSSFQLDTPGRGFSFRHDAALDMRFGRTGPTAADLLASIDEGELMRILYEYGEEPRARRVARAIVRARQRAPIGTTGELRRIVADALGRGGGRTDPATRTFQALRIATNRELDELPGALDQAAHVLRPLGRLVTIAFHSIEDRLVKRRLRHLSGGCVCPPGQAVCECEPETALEKLTRKPLRPSAAELERNPRARSARLRAAQRRA
jgi:16S rRNA (cytosine1402-N4)-methyltransferase